MSDSLEKTSKVTKPIQLLAAWLAGLAVVDASFLSTAKLMGVGTLECRVLIASSILNVYVFIAAIFVLQTRFRPELQEDLYYSKYIDKKTGVALQLNKVEILEKHIEELRIKDRARESEKIEPLDWLKYRVAVNDHIPFFQNLKISLAKSGIAVSTVFGKNEGIETAPSRFLISIDENCPSTYAIALLKICCNFPFDGFYRWDRIVDVEDESIYLGAYGQTDQIAVQFTEQTIKKIAVAETDSDYESLFKKRGR